jgi:hypothetical protein
MLAPEGRTVDLKKVPLTIDSEQRLVRPPFPSDLTQGVSGSVRFRIS